MKKQTLTTALLVALLSALLALPILAAPTGTIADVQNAGTKLIFHPVVEFNELILTVTGPCDFEYRQVVRPGDLPVFPLGETTIDGAYTFNLTLHERIDAGIVDFLRQARAANDLEAPKKLCRLGKLPGPPEIQSSGFLIANGKIVYDPLETDGRFADGPDFDEMVAQLQVPQASTVPGAGGFVPAKDFVINDDLIVDGSACIGFDCVNGESFGFDTIRLKENNLRIKFDDTSVAASFPRNDWQLTANDSANGGASKFSIDDISGGRTPFTVEANARSHSLYVDDGGRIGNRTSTPSTEIHTIDGDTPTLRLQQDGSSGFAPQTWDVAGNETNFFIRDVTNGSALPFRIRPGAPTSAIHIADDGDVGIGTASPGAALHVQRSNGTAQVFVQDTSGNDTTLMLLESAGVARFNLRNAAASNWRFTSAGNGDFVMNLAGAGINPLSLTTAGDMTIQGTLTQNSDRNAKTDIVPVDPTTVLERLASLPISEWRYKDNSPNVRHIGPMAQDFFAAFGLNGHDLGIATLDTSGVALAAIQGLSAELEQKDEKISDLETRLAELEAIVKALAER